MTDRLEVQAETIMMANARLDDVTEAFEAQAQESEANLQRTGAFWIEKLAAAREETGEASRLRAALVEAQVQREQDLQRTGAYWIGRVRDLKFALETAEEAGSSTTNGAEKADKAGAGEVSAEVQRLKNAHAAELAVAAHRAEVQLQSTAAFWIPRMSALKADAAKA